MNVPHRLALLVALTPVALLAAACNVDDPADAPSSDEPLGDTAEALSPTDWSSLSFVTNGDYAPALASMGSYVYLVHGGTGTYDNHLYWSRYNGSSWTSDVAIPNQLSATTPSIAAFNGYLYMVHSGNASPNQVWISRFDPSTSTWSTNYQLPLSSIGSPAIASFGGKLHIIRVNPSDHRMYLSTMNTSEVLSSDVAIPMAYSTTTPSLAVLNGRLFVAHNDWPSDEIVVGSYDGSSWGANINPGGGVNGVVQETSYPPALAAYGGQLHLLHREPNHGDYVWWSYSSNGLTWTPEVSVPTLTSKVNVALAPMSTKLVVVDRLLHFSQDKTNTYYGVQYFATFQ